MYSNYTMESYLITRNTDEKSQEGFFGKSSIFPTFNLNKEISHKDVGRMNIMNINRNTVGVY